ncbi:MAG: primosomal protein N' [Proteobacteria bacterium]|nr:primosomal protein N' [Pseudomonadota bacterium]
MNLVKVIVPLFLPKALDYIYNGENPEVGEFVKVHVGKAWVTGVIHAIKTETDYEGKLKRANPTEYCLSLETLKFFDWVNRYNIAFPGESLRACLISNNLPDDKSFKTVLKIENSTADRITKQRQKVLDELGKKDAQYSKSELAKRLEISTSVIKTMIEKSFLSENEIKIQDSIDYKSPAKHVELNQMQQDALDVTSAAIQSKVFNPILLDGVTGSGKTEVFFKAIDEILQEEGTQCLVLVPEISLTPQLLVRFEEHFGFKPSCYHSGMTKSQKSRTWHNVLNGSSRVVIGARSALFLPFKNLKFIVVDEEHDSSFKQEDNFKYNARDMAIVRAKIGGFSVMLSSATPSLQTWFNAQTQKFKQIVLPSRFGEAQMPDIELIDMKKEKISSDRFISNTLQNKLQKNIEDGNQSLIFLNRRGNAPLLICRTCGHRHTCANCDVYMVVHGQKLVCHHCGLTESYPEQCPTCENEKLFAFGVGTRKLFTELQGLFPKARIAIADTDIIKTNNQMGELISKVENHEVDILIGTQMIAKGLNFKELTLVGVVDADMGLNNSDLRAAEQTYQLISQVAGRAGRYDKKGEVCLQTYIPDHEIFGYLKELDRDGFFNLELKSRKFGKYPPYGKLAAILIKSKDKNKAQNAAMTLVRNFPDLEGVELLGPAPMTIFRVNDVWRFRILIKSKANIHKHIKAWLATTAIAKGVRIDIDIDPQTLY